MRIWASLLLYLLSACLWAEAGAPGDKTDPLLTFPILVRPSVVAVDPPPLGELIPGVIGVRMVRGERVSLDAVVNLDRGPVDGLEVFACLKDGKTHESLLRLETTSGQMVKFACIAALGLDTDGVSTAEGSGMPARGTPVRVRVMWTDADDGKARVIDASCMVRDRIVDRAYPPLPYVYTGSRFQTVQRIGADGQLRRQEIFMLESTRSIIVNFDEPDALIASPFPGAIEDSRFEVNSAIVPSVGTPMELLIEKARLPAMIDMDDTGSLRPFAEVDGPSIQAPLDDQSLSQLLVAAYGSAMPSDGLRAIGIRVRRGTDRTRDVAARARLLSVAAAAQVWVVPVFVLAGD